MKVNKQELAELTEEAAKIGLLTLATLAVSRCPIPEIYERIEKFGARVDDLRESLGLERLNPPELGQGMLSQTVRQKMFEMESSDSGGKSSIGFQIPKNDPSKMN